MNKYKWNRTNYKIVIEMSDNWLKNKFKVNIQFCKSCDTHTWCTHHNQDKYKQAYLQLAQAIAKQFPGLPVLGNQMPPNLVPIKAKQNKYYDTEEKKYVIFPSIGAFEVYLNSDLIFSKKNNNTWPINAQILNQIHIKIKGVPRRVPTQSSVKTSEKFEISQKQQKQTVKMANQILSSIDRNSTFYREKTKKQLTLTDHFKKYQMKKKSQDDLQSLYAESQAPSRSTISPITAEDIRKLHHIWGKKQNLPNFIKNKAFIQLREGKKEMLVNLSSIEQENELKQTFVAPKVRKNKISNLQIEFQKLQNKLRKFQCRVSEVNTKKFGFDAVKPLQQQRQKKGSKFSFIDKIQQVKTAYNAQKFVKLIKDKKKRMIQEYIHATSEQKNEKLEQIYGPQYLKPSMGISKVRPKNSQISKRLDNLQIENKRNQNSSESQSENSSFLQEQQQEQSCSESLMEPPKRQTNSACSNNKNQVNRFNFTQGRFQTKNKFLKTKEKLTSDHKLESFQYLSPFQKEKRQFQSRSLMHKPVGQKTLKKNVENNRKTEADDNKFEKNQKVFELRFNNKVKGQSKQSSANKQTKNTGSYLKKAARSSLNLNKKWVEKQKRKQLKAPVHNNLDNINQIPQFQETQRKFTQASKRSQLSQSSDLSKISNKEHSPKILAQDQNQATQLKKVVKKKDSQQFKSKFQEKLQEMEALKQTGKNLKKTQKQTKQKVKQNLYQNSSQLQAIYHSSQSKREKKIKSTKRKKGQQKKTENHNGRESQNKNDEEFLKSSGYSGSEKNYKSSKKPNSNENRLDLVHHEKNVLLSEAQQKQYLNEDKSELIQLNNTLNPREESKVEIQQNKLNQSFHQNEAYQSVNSGHKKEDSKTKAQKEQIDQKKLKVPHQENNVGSQSRPRRIYEIDEERPEMVDVAVQKNYRIPVRQKGSQTVHSNQESPKSDYSHNILENNSKQGDSNKENKQKKQNKQSSFPILGSPSPMKKQQQEQHFDVEETLKKHQQSQQQSEVTINHEFQGQHQLLQNINENKIKTTPMATEQIATKKGIFEDHHKIVNLGNEEKPKAIINMQKATIIKQFYGDQYEEKLKNETIIKPEASQNCQSQGRKRIKIKELYQKKGRLFERNAIGCDKLIIRDERLMNLSRIIKILCEKNQFLIIRLFQNPEYSDAGCFQVWLCNNYAWDCYEVSHVQVDSNLQPLSIHHSGLQRWPTILVQALSVMFSGIEKLSEASVPELFHALTGSSYLSFKVKEDPEKNSRLLKFISQNQKKNFIIRAEKRMHCSLGESIEQKKQSTSFFILSQKTVNEKQILLRMKKTNSEAFWIKLQKFVSQFFQVDVLQLRVNHNFCSVSLNDCNPGHFKIVQFVFSEECFGSVVAVTGSKSTDFKMYLYKEEEDSVLRLVGQASDKNKKMTFFDCCFEEGKYLLFTDIKWVNNRICYMGEGRPKMSIKQQVKQMGLKSDYTEYIPISNMPEKKQPMMPAFLNMTRKSQKSSMVNVEWGKQKKPKQEQVDRQKLREEFVDYLASNP